MPVAALYDIHGNLPALEAVLAEFERNQIERVVVGGDVVPGPMWRESLGQLLALDLPVDFIYGNCEIGVLAELDGKDSALTEQVRWTAHQLNAEERRMLDGWPKTLRVNVSGIGEVLFCHGTPRHENEIFTRLTPEERLLPIFEPLRVVLVVCGHTHMQFDRMIGSTRVVNAGSVGMPFGAAGAHWLLLGPGADIQLKRTHYDLPRAAARVRATPYPQAEDFAMRYVLDQPSERQMLELFGRAELRESPT